MRPRLIASALFLLSAAYACAQQSDGHLRLVFAGDLMGHIPLHKAAQQSDGSYDYEPCFRYVREYIESADIAVVNLEVTLAGKPYTGFPCFSSPDAYAAAARNAGFDIFATANNHCVDKGRRGIERTIRILDSLDIIHLGTYTDLQQQIENHPLIITCNGIRLALLSYTYGTNGIAVPKPNVVNFIDTVQMLNDIKTAHRCGADFVIALMHWGVEYQKHSNREQERLTRWLFDNGCDAVIGGHPHVVQNLTIDANPDNDRYPEPVVYSMGNFYSNQHDEGCEGGIMVELELLKTNNKTEVYSCSYMPVFVHRATVDGRRQYQLVPSTDALAYPNSYGITAAEMASLKRFDSATRTLLQKGQNTFEAYQIQERRFYENRRPVTWSRNGGYQLFFGNPLSGPPLRTAAWKTPLRPSPLAPRNK